MEHNNSDIEFTHSLTSEEDRLIRQKMSEWHLHVGEVGSGWEHGSNLDPEPRGNTAVLMIAYNESRLYDFLLGLSQELKVPIYCFCDGTKPSSMEGYAKARTIQDVYVLDSGAERKGYSKAMRDALCWMFNYTKYTNVFITDSDDSYSHNDIKVILDMPDTNISGARYNRISTEPLFRRGYIKCEGVLMRILFRIKMQDYTAVCRKLDLVDTGRVAYKMKYSPRSFWLEFDARWKHQGYKPHWELPVKYHGHPSKIYSPKSMPKIILSEFWALIKTRWEFIWH